MTDTVDVQCSALMDEFLENLFWFYFESVPDWVDLYKFKAYWKNEMLYCLHSDKDLILDTSFKYRCCVPDHLMAPFYATDFDPGYIDVDLHTKHMGHFIVPRNIMKDYLSKKPVKSGKHW